MRYTHSIPWSIQIEILSLYTVYMANIGPVEDIHFVLYRVTWEALTFECSTRKTKPPTYIVYQFILKRLFSDSECYFEEWDYGNKEVWKVLSLWVYIISAGILNDKHTRDINLALHHHGLCRGTWFERYLSKPDPLNQSLLFIKPQIFHFLPANLCQIKKSIPSLQHFARHKHLIALLFIHNRIPICEIVEI